MKKHRFLAILLAVVMLFGMIPSDAFAATPPAEEPIPVPTIPAESPPELGEDLPMEETEPGTEIPTEEPPPMGAFRKRQHLLLRRCL